LAVIDHLIVLLVWIFWLDHATKDQNLLAGDLNGTSIDNLQLEAIGDIVDCFPNISFDVKSLDFFNIGEWLFVTNSCLWLQALSSDNENVLFIELAYTKALSWFIKAGEHDPLFTSDREEFASVQTLDEGLSSVFLFSIGHTSQNVDIVFEFVHNMISSRVEHVRKRL
jgi:hypothetical protein